MAATSTLPSSSSKTVDPWDQTASTTSAPRRLATRAAPAVRDDWEDDADEDDEGDDLSPPQPPSEDANANKQLWEDANAKPSQPMPSLVFSPAAKLATPAIAAAVAYNQPAMRILKRPSSNSNSGSQSPGSSNLQLGKESLKERERKYQEARERIFGAEAAEEPSVGLSSGKADEQGSAAAAKVIREPKGPSAEDGATGDIKGFGARQGKQKLPTGRPDAN